MKVLITGANGQLGKELTETAAATIDLSLADKAQLDIGDACKVLTYLETIRPAVVINAAAYTAVDNAESDHDAAYRINEKGSANLAVACKAIGARLLHVSTDFVFDGQQGQAYAPDYPTHPIGVYGASKLAGEKAIQTIAPEDYVIVRTAWVYSKHNNNFMKTMLRLMRERDQLGVVSDQIGTPTSARGLAKMLWAVMDRPQMSGIFHWTDSGAASWYDFAVAIQEEAFELGLLEKKVPIRPIAASDYPTPAARPAFSVLDKTTAWAQLGHTGVHWRVALRAVLADFKQLQSQI